MNIYCNEFFGIGQQEIYFDLYLIGLPSDDPVYALKKVLEELNYASLTAQYSTKGRKGYNPIMISQYSLCCPKTRISQNESKKTNRQ